MRGSYYSHGVILKWFVLKIIFRKPTSPDLRLLLFCYKIPLRAQKNGYFHLLLE